MSLVRQSTQAFNLRFLAVRITWWELVLVLEVTYPLSRFEALGQKVDKLCVKVVDAPADGVELLKHFILDLTLQRAGVRVE